VAHAVGDLYERHAADTEQALIEAYTVPAEASGIAVSLDRVCVPVEEPRARPAGRPRQGAPKKPVKRVFRQAYCATITLHDGAGKALHTIRYGRMPEQDVTGLCESLCDDVLTLLKARPALMVTALCDGAHELWALIAEHLAAVVERTPIVELVDLWHLLEKLGSAAREHLQASEAEAQVERWRLVLLNRPRAAEKIRLQLASWVTEGAPSGAGTALHDAQTFLTNHAHRFRYAEAGLRCERLHRLALRVTQEPDGVLRERRALHVVQQRRRHVIEEQVEARVGVIPCGNRHSRDLSQIRAELHQPGTVVALRDGDTRRDRYRWPGPCAVDAAEEAPGDSTQTHRLLPTFPADVIEARFGGLKQVQVFVRCTVV
jgi:hypothetical protein